jgi:hypothetical protein
MTCREFKHNAASLNLWELTQNGDEEIFGHAGECEACGSWLQKQRQLAVSVQTLQARTAGLEAGPDVERALLRVFRQDTLQGADHALRGVKERSGSYRPAVTPLSTPMALRLSRFFEVGAYVAFAAALLVGMFLGVRLLEHHSSSTAMQSQNAPANVEPVANQATPAAKVIAEAPVSGSNVEPVTLARKRVHASSSPEHVTARANDDSQELAEATYTPLMFCDPLSCAADTQVVRVELPATGQSSQPQMADLVVGYDGVVRAVRMVN